jgi:nicotinamidase-related amidase
MIERKTSALVVVDMQNDFLAQGGYYDEITRLTRAKNGVLSQADVEALSQLYQRPPSSCVIRDAYQELVAAVAEVASASLARQVSTIFVRTTYDPASRYRPPLFIAAPDRRDYACHPGTWGSELIDPIESLASDPYARIVEKHTFDAFFETELRGLLRFWQIDTVYLAGIETNICVLCTALSALTNGFRTVILEDCVTTSVPSLHAPALRIIKAAKGQTMVRQHFLASL